MFEHKGNLERELTMAKENNVREGSNKRFREDDVQMTDAKEGESFIATTPKETPKKGAKKPIAAPTSPNSSDDEYAMVSHVSCFSVYFLFLSFLVIP
jgi:hypothetical protein